MDSQRRRARRPRSDRPRQPDLRLERVQPGRAAAAAAEGRLPPAAADAGARRGARHVDRRRGGAGDEGVGARARRDPLHALVSAADGVDRREARQLLWTDGRGLGSGRVLGQGADPGRARRLQLPHGRDPRHIRGSWLHGMGPDQPGLPAREPEWRAALHPNRVRVVDRRGAGPQDPAAALDGRAVEVRDPRAETVRQQLRPAGVHDRRTGAGVLPDRRAVLLRAARPDHDGTHAVRGQAAQGSRARRPLLRLDPGADSRLHARDRARARQARRAGEDAPQRGRAKPVRDRAGVRELQRRLGSSAADDAGHAERRSPLRPCVPAAREAVRGRQRLGQAQQLVDGHRHRARTSSTRATRPTTTCSSCSSAPP